MDTPRNDPGDMLASVPELTAAMVRGDEAAFTRFHRMYWWRVYAYVIVLSRGKEDIAADVAQTVMIQAATRLKVVESEGALWGWLSRVARNAFIDLCRKSRDRARSIELTDDSFSESGRKDPNDAPILAALERGLKDLTLEERRLIEEVYFAGRRQDSVAGELGISLKALESRLTRLRRKLRGFILCSLCDE